MSPCDARLRSCSGSRNCYNYGGTGGDTSAYETEPSYQTGFHNPSGAPTPTINTGGKRGYADVSYDADPNTGMAILDSGQGGWLQIGGTSAGAPQWAALIAIADQQRAGAGKRLLDTATSAWYTTGSTAVTSMVYNIAHGTQSSRNFHDILTGTAGRNSAGSGYDKVTGIGSPFANQLIQSLANA